MAGRVGDQAEPAGFQLTCDRPVVHMCACVIGDIVHRLLYSISVFRYSGISALFYIRLVHTTNMCVIREARYNSVVSCRPTSMFVKRRRWQCGRRRRTTHSLRESRLFSVEHFGASSSSGGTLSVDVYFSY